MLNDLDQIDECKDQYRLSRHKSLFHMNRSTNDEILMMIHDRDIYVENL